MSIFSSLFPNKLDHIFEIVSPILNLKFRRFLVVLKYWQSRDNATHVFDFEHALRVSLHEVDFVMELTIH